MIGAEAWRPVVGYEDRYEVSDQGRVRSKPRLVENAVTCYISRPLLLAQSWCGRTLTYRRVQLMVNGQKITKRVHILVAEAFLGPCPPGMEVAHADDIGDHNWLGNLSYQTHADNCADRGRERREYTEAELVGIGNADGVPF